MALISFAVTAKLICVFVFAYAKIRFSRDEAHLSNDDFKNLQTSTQSIDSSCLCVSSHFILLSSLCEASSLLYHKVLYRDVFCLP